MCKFFKSVKRNIDDFIMILEETERIIGNGFLDRLEDVEEGIPEETLEMVRNARKEWSLGTLRDALSYLKECQDRDTEQWEFRRLDRELTFVFVGCLIIQLKASIEPGFVNKSFIARTFSAVYNVQYLAYQEAVAADWQLATQS